MPHVFATFSSFAILHAWTLVGRPIVPISRPRRVVSMISLRGIAPLKVALKTVGCKRYCRFFSEKPTRPEDFIPSPAGQPSSLLPFR